MLRFHYHPFSTFARRVHITLLEKDIPHEKLLVDLPARAQRQPAYLAMNPYGRVPVIDDAGFVLYESSAIMMYLEQTRGGQRLLPDNAQDKALVDMHLRLCDLQFAPHARNIVFPKRFSSALLSSATWASVRGNALSMRALATPSASFFCASNSLAIYGKSRSRSASTSTRTKRRPVASSLSPHTESSSASLSPAVNFGLSSAFAMAGSVTTALA